MRQSQTIVPLSIGYSNFDIGIHLLFCYDTLKGAG